MNTQLFELKNSFKLLIQNLITRIDSVCQSIKKDEVDQLIFWMEDLSTFTEVMMILTQKNAIDFDLYIFNEKIDLLINKVEEKDYLFVEDILKFELKPLLSYWDGCITND